MKQPLNYQTLPCSCWVTSVTNGLLYLFGDKKKIPGFVARLLNSVLTDEGVDGGGPTKADWEIVLEAVASKCSIDVKSFTKSEVETSLEHVDFQKSIVICDIRSGNHSILINGKEGEWYLAFDPDWDQVKDKKCSEDEYEKLPKLKASNIGRVNVKIHKNHLLKKVASKHNIFAMGAMADRSITVITKNV